MAGGLRLNLGFYNGKSDDLETHYITTTLSPFLRFYLLPALKKVNAFIDVSYIHNKQDLILFPIRRIMKKPKGILFRQGQPFFLQSRLLWNLL